MGSGEGGYTQTLPLLLWGREVVSSAQEKHIQKKCTSQKL